MSAESIEREREVAISLHHDGELVTYKGFVKVLHQAQPTRGSLWRYYKVLSDCHDLPIMTTSSFPPSKFLMIFFSLANANSEHTGILGKIVLSFIREVRTSTHLHIVQHFI